MPKEEKFKPHVGLLFLAVQFIFEFFPLSTRYPWMFLWFLKIGLLDLVQVNLKIGMFKKNQTKTKNN